VSDGSLIRTLEGHEEWVYDVEFVPGEEYLVSNGREDTSPLELKIKFWRVSSGDLYLYYDELALDLEYSPSGEYFVYGQADGNIVVANSPVLPENHPPGRPDIDGPDMGVPGTEYIYVLNAVDLDNDDIKNHINWGDDNTEITEFNPSGTDVIVKHTWTQKGTYIISVYAEDVNGLNGPIATNPIIIPRNKVLNIPLFRFIQQHQNLFPIFRLIQGL